MRKRTSEGQALPIDLDDLLAFGDPSRYEAAVPTPRQALDYDLGERLSTHADCLCYLRALALASPRARCATFGESVEGRELMQLTVTSPANLARLDGIRAGIQRLADVAAPLPELDDLPVIVWIIANVHGGEHSSAEAALALAYHLCAATDDATAAILRDAVVVIDPLQNPDGRDRSVAAHRSLHGVQANPDPNSCEHSPPWPGPRGSHYAFDLNRDWCLLTHPESRARVESFLAWRPQVVADLHEMGCNESYYFPPPAVPVEVNVAASLRGWWEVFGRANAAAFDARGWDYFVGETFDSYYPGYGEAWPLYHGALGMTYEQASPRTLGVRRLDGRILTLREALGKHFVAAYTTCAVAAAHRRELLEAFRTFHAEAVALGEAGPERALLIDAGDRPADALELAELLRAQGVRVEQAGGPFTATVTPHPGGPAEERTLCAGSLVIPLAQPAGRLVRALCSAEAPLPAEYVLEERERLRRRAEPNIYDITSWSLPHAHGLEACWAGQVPVVTPPPSSPRAKGAGTAWLVPAGTRASYRLACRVVTDEAWRPRLATRELRLDGRCYGRGTLVLRVNDHGADLPARLAELAAETGAEVVPADTSWSESGVRLGSIHVVGVRRPKVAMLTRPPVGAHSAGWLAYLLEQVYRLPYTPLDAGSLSEKVLSEYNVLLLPDSGGYGKVFGDGVLKRWVSVGGTAVALGGGAAGFLAEQELTSARRVTDLRRAHDEPKPPEKDAPPVPAEHRPRGFAGVTVWTELDPYSFLSYGCPSRLRVPYNTDALFRPSVEGYNVATFPAAGELLAAGFAPDGMEAALRGQVYLWQEHVGAGQVVCFADAPTFRASWPMLDRLWLNAVLFGVDRKRE